MTLPSAASLQYAGADADLPSLAQAHDANVDALTYLLNGGMQLGSQMGAKVLTVPITMPDTQWVDVNSTVGFKNGWSNTGGGPANAGYRIEPNGRVIGRGNVTGGTVNAGGTGTIFTLPSVYAPSSTVKLAVESNGAYGMCLVTSGGDVRAAVGNNTSFSLDSLDFFAASPSAAPRVFNPSGTQTITGVQLWPVTVKHGLKSKCVGVALLGCILTSGQGIGTVLEGGASSPYPALDLTPDDGNGNILVNAVYGLSPGKTYSLTLLAITG
jgi:hypothetical protein